MRHFFTFVTVVACACSSAPPRSATNAGTTEWKLGSDCSIPAADEFFIARKQGSHEAVAVGSHAIPATAGPLPFPTAAVATACGGVEPLLKPLCMEGAGGQYGHAVVQSIASGTDVHDMVAQLEQLVGTIDANTVPIACRGLGMAFAETGRDTLDKVLPILGQRCRMHAIDGYGYRLAMQIGTNGTPACKKSANRDPGCVDALDGRFEQMNADTMCAGGDPEWCEYGIGRALGNTYPGSFEAASRFCRGPHRGACLAGIGFVAIFLYPERIERALDVAVHLDPADQPRYFEGITNGLAWRGRSDAAEVAKGTSAASADAQALTKHLTEEAQRCGLVDFAGGKDCHWPTVKQCPKARRSGDQ